MIELVNQYPTATSILVLCDSGEAIALDSTCRVCRGVIFRSVEMVSQLMVKATTQAGLKVFTAILDAVY